MINNIKTLTMYLPQYHAVKENDEWWGKGFTEWVTVKNAKPLFEGHKQPIVPLNQNYYNLLDKTTMLEQAKLMKQYGIDGQCFYHYYFKEGRKILEKPAEKLLEWKDIEMSFCFCWANGSWSRTWSKFSGNSWADKFENNKKEGNGVLLEQKYGREDQWKKHFEYLLPFFKDERYIKVNNAPIFMFYLPQEIYCLSQMLELWRDMAKENGFSGVYAIGMNLKYTMDGLDALLLHAPHAFWDIRHAEIENKVIRPNYDVMWRNIINEKPVEGIKTYFEGVANCDDTPRRGCSNGVAIKGFSINKFKEGMKNLYKKSISLHNEFVFINAWNEWGEGMHLEPDEEYKFQYLEAVRDAQMEAIKEPLESKYDFVGEQDIAINQLKREIEKQRQTIRCYNLWLAAKEEHRKLSEYLGKFNIKTVAIYGIGVLGKHLITELEESDVVIKFLIDAYSARGYRNYETKSANDNFPKVDAIIVSVVGEYNDIYKALRKKVDYPIFSLLELVSEI